MFSSRMSGYTNVLMMNTDQHLHFRDELQRQWTTAQAAGSMQTMQQAGVGGLGGGGGLGATKGWAGMPWYTISSLLYSFAPYMIVICGILTGVVFAMKGSQVMMFSALFPAIFFLMFFILFITASQRSGILTGRNFFVSLFGSMIGAGIVSFVLYSPDDKNPPPPPVASGGVGNPTGHNTVPPYRF